MTEHIQVGDITPRIQYLVIDDQTVEDSEATPPTSRAATPFTVPFPFFADADLQIFVGDILQTLDVDYTVSGAGESAGGSVTFLTLPAVGASVTILRKLKIERLVDFQVGGAFRAKEINDQLDRQIAMIQQVASETDRALTLAPTDAAGSAVLPDAAARANALLGFDADGAPIAAGGGSGDVAISADMTPVVQAASPAAARTALGLEIGADVQAYQKHNFTAGGAPTVNDDAPNGYGVGSRWVDIINDRSFVCVDATAGAAVWLSNAISTAVSPKAADYTVAPEDEGKLIACTGNITITLPTGGVTNGFTVWLRNTGSRAVALSPAGGTIDGAATVTLYPGQACLARFDGTTYLTAGRPDRWALTGDVTLYVDGANGDDANDGLAAGSGNALATIQAAADLIGRTLDPTIHQVTISVAAGTYTGGVDLPFHIGSKAPIIDGDTATPSNVTLSTTADHCFDNATGAAWIVQGFRLETTTSGHAASSRNGGSALTLKHIEFGACAHDHMEAREFGYLEITTDYTIDGGARYHMVVTNNGSLWNAAKTVTLNGTPAFSIFVQQWKFSVVDAWGVTWSGGATGQRFLNQGNGVINTSGGGSSYFPGNSGGSSSSGAQYL